MRSIGIIRHECRPWAFDSRAKHADQVAYVRKELPEDRQSSKPDFVD
tara:strand:- start:651 stop:791 length:141 start_codon:yes stop_codon:yes gene_type:complete